MSDKDRLFKGLVMMGQRRVQEVLGHATIAHSSEYRNGGITTFTRGQHMPMCTRNKTGSVKRVPSIDANW